MHLKYTLLPITAFACRHNCANQDSAANEVFDVDVDTLVEQIEDAEVPNENPVMKECIEGACFAVETGIQVMTTGYWSELCNQLRTKNATYFSKMYFSQDVYLALIYDDDFQQHFLKLCPTATLNLPTKSDIKGMFDEDWEYIQPDGIYKVNGLLTRDLELYFEVQDIRNLFDWQKQNFVRICEFAAGQLQTDTQIDQNVDLDQSPTFMIAVAEVLTALSLFNYLTEVSEARQSLYLVCSNNVDLKQRFTGLYANFEQFDLLFQ